MERRLAAILSADVVGYSRLMSDDEAGTLIALQQHRQLVIDPAVSAHQGRIVDFIGDNFLAEFQSVADAVSCAVEIQSELALANQSVVEDRRMLFRMGINLGDVIADDDRLYGDGVNVAARLETLAEPGGVYLSRAAYEQVRDKLDIRFEDLDEFEVKNIARPIRVYRVVFDRSARPAAGWSDSRRKLAATAIASALIAAGYVVTLHYWPVAPDISAQESTGGGKQSKEVVEPQAVKTAMEVTFWNSVKGTGDPAIIRTYIEEFPDGQFTGIARREIERIEDEVAAARVEAEQARKAREEAEAAKQHQAMMEAEAQRLAQAKEGEMRQALARLRARQQAELADWEKVRSTADASVLERFLQRHPDGTFNDLARAKLEAVRHQQQAALQAQANAKASADPLYELGLVLKIQQHLVRLGCYRGKPDGVWGKQSQQALESYAQHSKTKLASLEPSPSLLDSLGGYDRQVCPR